MNMTFISASEVKNIYFMSGEATNEVYDLFNLQDEIKVIFMKKFEFSFYYIQFRKKFSVNVVRHGIWGVLL